MRVSEADCDNIVHYIGDTDMLNYEVVLFCRELCFMCDTLDRYKNPEKLFTFNTVYVSTSLRTVRINFSIKLGLGLT